MNREAAAAGGNGLVIMAGPAVLFGQLRKSDRRRVALDPASKLFNPRVISHCCSDPRKLMESL
jgi:hypothetical protein